MAKKKELCHHGNAMKAMATKGSITVRIGCSNIIFSRLASIKKEEYT